MKTNVLVGWAKEVYGVAVEKFPDRPFTFKELRTAIEWEEYHPDVKSLDAVLLANLQTLRNRKVVTFVSRGVYQLTGATAPVIESTIDSSVPPSAMDILNGAFAEAVEMDIKDRVISEGQVPTPRILTTAQSVMMKSLVHGATLNFRSNH